MGKQIVLEGERIATGYRQGKQVAEVHQGLDFCLVGGGELTCLLGMQWSRKVHFVAYVGRHAAPFVRPSGTHGEAFGGLQCA